MTESRKCVPRLPIAAIALCACLIIALCPRLAGASSARPPQAPAPPVTSLVEHVRGEMVLVEVHVTGPKGRPVPGLTLEDFTLHVDASPRPQPLSTLEYLGAPAPAGGVSGEEGAGPAGAAAIEAIPSAVPADAIGPPGRHFVIFFEDANSQPTNMTAARLAVEKFLAVPGLPGDAIAIASYNGRSGLRIMHDFTSDRAALIEVVHASLRDTSRYSDLESITSAPGIRQPEVASQEDYQSLRHVLESLGSLSDGLASWPGYKAIVYIGDGIPDNAGSWHGRASLRYDLSSGLSGLTTAAAAANVTVHVLQTSGLVAGGPGEISGASIKRNGLAALSLNTGGLNLATNDLRRGLAGVDASTIGDYVLGFVPDGPPDGRYHSIVLKTRRPDLRLGYRRGFVRLRPEETRERIIQAAFNAPELHPDLGLQLAAVGGPAGQSDRALDLLIYVPPGKLLALPGPGGAEAVLDVGITALGRDRHVTVRTSRRVTAPLGSRSDADHRPPGLDLFTRVRLPLDAQDVRVVISDVQAEVVGAARLNLESMARTAPPADVRVPAALKASTGEATIPHSAARVVMGPSLLSAVEDSLWIEIPADSSEGQAATSAIVPRIGPAAKTRFGPGEDIVCEFGLESPLEPGSPELRLAIMQDNRLVRALSIDPRLAEGPQGGQAEGTVRVPVALAGLPPGDYVMQLQEMRSAGPAGLGRYAFRIEPCVDAGT